MDRQSEQAMQKLHAMHEEYAAKADVRRAELVERLRDEIEEQAILNGKGAEREAKLLAELQRSERDCAALRKAAEGMAEALAIADDAIREMFRYYDGGETRGSYDGRPERNQLRKAGYVTRTALSQYRRES